MVEFQVCAAALDEPCLSLPKLPVLPLPHPDRSAYQHSSQHIPNKVGERTETFDDGRGSGGVSSERVALKRARLEEDEELSISPMDLSGPKDSGPPFLHHHQQFYHHHPGVETTNNFATAPSLLQQVMPEQNGHATLSDPVESHFEAVTNLMGDRSNHHSAGLLSMQMPGQDTQDTHFPAVNVADVIAELERERRKNVELQGRVSCLEAQLVCNDKHGPPVQNGTKKNKKQRRAEKAEKTPGEGELENAGNVPEQSIQLPAIKQEKGELLQMTLPVEAQEPSDRQDTVVTWMSREDVTPADLEKLNKDMVSEQDDSGDSDDDDDEDEEVEEEFEEEDGEGRAKKKRKSEKEQGWKALGMKNEARRGGVLDLKDEAEKLFFFGASGEGGQEEDESDGGRKKIRRRNGKEGQKDKQGEKMLVRKRSLGHDLIAFRGPGIISSYKKSPKTAFCPKEVKRVMESGVLSLKNAQSHTMRKIIVFASLGIRHGCEDLYELDIRHFSVVRRGEPHKSPKDPGEHVLYDQPGLRTKIFYPNRKNPTLCPVRILDEEMAMRPVGTSCPTCLFLCIKYGGRTRNHPQNEYVRQRMGRNKLKSFGPLMCQMALLVHIRTGSFFFKALGITLLFMAGFPDDLVRKETKYRNLDLLQKYYRSDEDAKGEQLFHPYPTFFPQAMIVPPQPTHKAAVAVKNVGKKGPPPLLSKPPSSLSMAGYLQPMTARPASTMPFRGLSPAFPPLPSIPTVPTSVTASGNPSTPAPIPPPLPPFGLYPPYPPMQGPPGRFVPMPWAPVNSYPPGPYPAPPFGYQAFPLSPHFVPPYYGPPLRFPPYPQPSKKEELKKRAKESQESESDVDSRSSEPGKKCDGKGDDKVQQ